MALRKYLYTLVAAATLGLTACDDYDDGALWDAVNDHESRLEALEKWQEQVNGNIAALQQLLSTTDYITKVTPIREDGRQVGYTIEFLNQPPITIYNGDKGDTGAPGQDGDDGQDGADGTDGKDGQTPEIGLVKGEDGNWYWTVNGEMILDGDKGDTGGTGPDGPQGGQGDAWLACAPEISEDGMYYIFTLSDDDNTDLSDNPTFKVPVYQGFSLGTGTLTLVSGKAEIEITPPAGTTAGDYQAMIAKITPEDGMSTRTCGSVEGWSVEADLANRKVTVTRQTSSNGTKALLRVTLLRNDGSEITASRMVAVPDYETDDNGTYIVYSANELYEWARNSTRDCVLANDITLPDAAEGGSNWTGSSAVQVYVRIVQCKQS